jgi:hypothetical protein
MPELSTIFQAAAATLAGGAAASGWTAAVIVANSAFDGLDKGRADRHLRRVLTATATFQAVLLAGAAGLAVLSGAIVTFVIALVAALGFLSNKWTLSPRREKVVPGARKRMSSSRIVAVSLTLMVTVLAAAVAVLAIIGL